MEAEMSKCMIKKTGAVIRVSKTEAKILHEKGEADYICKDQYRRLTAQKDHK
jgi:hypothetical protein